MKKFLLMALSTLIVGTAPAQKFTQKGKVVKTNSVVSKDNQSKVQIKDVTLGDVKAFKRGKKQMPSKKIEMQANEKFQAIGKLGVSAINRAGVVQPEYTGVASVTGNGTSPWTMQAGTLTTGENCFVDVIPNPYPDQLAGGIPATYTQSGNTITIPCQVAFYTSSYYVFLCSYYYDDIILVVDENGALSLNDSADKLYYMAFPTDTYDATWSTALGYIEYAEDIRYTLPGEIIPPIASYESEGFFLYPSMNIDWSGYLNAIIPAYSPVTLKSNTTDQADEWSWTLNEAVISGNALVEGDVVATSDTETLDFTSGSDYYMPASFVAFNQGASSEPFTLTEGTWLAGYPGYLYDDGTEDATILSKANLASHTLSTLNPEGIHSFILYQGKPAAPLFFTGVNLLVRQFESTANFEMTCKVYRAQRTEDGGIELGELIAQSDLDKENILTGGYDGTARLNWNGFYVEDEFGMSVGLDYLLLEDEFALVFEGWENNTVNNPNGTFGGRPLASTAWGNVRQTSTYVILVGEEEYTGSAFWSTYGNVLAGFNDSGYGYLYTEDDTNVTIPADGGEVSITVHPMFYANDENGNPTTYLWIDDEEAWPEWLGIEFTNEIYTNETTKFDLVFSADALPAGVTNREAELTFVQDLAKLVVKVSQSGEATGITTTVTKVTENGKAYNLSGRQVKAGQKGLIIRDGKKYIVK